MSLEILKQRKCPLTGVFCNSSRYLSRTLCNNVIRILACLLTEVDSLRMKDVVQHLRHQQFKKLLDHAFITTLPRIPSHKTTFKFATAIDTCYVLICPNRSVRLRSETDAKLRNTFTELPLLAIIIYHYFLLTCFLRSS